MNEFFYALILFALLMGFGIYILSRGQKALVKQLDGRLSQLLAVSIAEAKARGVVIGREEIEKERAQLRKERL